MLIILQQLECSRFVYINSFLMLTFEETIRAVKSGEYGGHLICIPHEIGLPLKIWQRSSIISSCWNHMSCLWPVSGCKKKKFSFLGLALLLSSMHYLYNPPHQKIGPIIHSDVILHRTTFKQMQVMLLYNSLNFKTSYSAYWLKPFQWKWVSSDISEMEWLFSK